MNDFSRGAKSKVQWQRSDWHSSPNGERGKVGGYRGRGRGKGRSMIWTAKSANAPRTDMDQVNHKSHAYDNNPITSNITKNGNFSNQSHPIITLNTTESHDNNNIETLDITQSNTYVTYTNISIANLFLNFSLALSSRASRFTSGPQDNLYLEVIRLLLCFFCR